MCRWMCCSPWHVVRIARMQNVRGTVKAGGLCPQTNVPEPRQGRDPHSTAGSGSRDPVLDFKLRWKRNKTSFE